MAGGRIRWLIYMGSNSLVTNDDSDAFHLNFGFSQKCQAKIYTQ